MPSNIEFIDAWLKFVDATHILWEHELKSANRPNLDNYKPLIDKIIPVIRDEEFISAIQQDWFRLDGETRTRIVAEVYLNELVGFAKGVDEALPRGEKKTDVEERKHDLLSNVKTIFGSTKDLFDNLPGWAKSTLTVAGEVADLFKRKK